MPPLHAAPSGHRRHHLPTAAPRSVPVLTATPACMPSSKRTGSRLPNALEGSVPELPKEHTRRLAQAQVVPVGVGWALHALISLWVVFRSDQKVTCRTRVDPEDCRRPHALDSELRALPLCTGDQGLEAAFARAARAWDQHSLGQHQAPRSESVGQDTAKSDRKRSTAWGVPRGQGVQLRAGQEPSRQKSKGDSE